MSLPYLSSRWSPRSLACHSRPLFVTSSFGSSCNLYPSNSKLHTIPWMFQARLSHCLECPLHSRVYLEIFDSKFETLLKNQLLCEAILALVEASLLPPTWADTTSLSSWTLPHLGSTSVTAGGPVYCVGYVPTSSDLPRARSACLSSSHTCHLAHGCSGNWMETDSPSSSRKRKERGLKGASPP